VRDRTLLDDKLTRWQHRALLVAGVGLVISIIAAIVNLEQFLEGYLVGFLFWWSATMGCLGLLMLTYLVGGYWSQAAKPFLESGGLLAPLTVLLFVPVALGLETLYPWTDPEAIPDYKKIYLNLPFFFGRAVVYFLVWCLLAWFLCRGAEGPSSEPPRWRRLLSAGGLVLLFLTVSFAAVDWGMSLDPMWFSSIYGAIVAISGALLAMSLVTLMLATLEKTHRPESSLITPDTLADLGTLTFAFLMLWTYFMFSQFLIIWSGNLPEENFWYIDRIEGGWEWIGIALIVLQFAVPFFLLLSRELKRSPAAMARITGWIVVMQFIGFLWLISPSFHPRNLFIHWADIVAPLTLGGIWVSGFLWLLRRRLPQILPREFS
jgi:hypothetical protein